MSLVLRLLASRLNVDILSVLALRDSSPREVAGLLGVDETEVSRRLRRMEKAGLVSSEWRRVEGRNMRVYSLVRSVLCFRLAAGGLEPVERCPGGGAPPAPPGAVREAFQPPSPPRPFVGREKLVQRIASAHGLLHVHGPPGIGKTSLVARALEESGRPRAWLRLAGGSTLRDLQFRVALYLSTLGLREPLGYVSSGGDPSSTAALLARGLDSANAVLVFDNAEEADRKTLSWIMELGLRLHRGLVVVVSRRRIPALAAAPRATVVELGGLSLRETALLLSLLGRGELDARRVHEATRGHPLLVRLAAAYGRVPERGDARGLWESLLSGLGQEERLILSMAACSPVPVEPQAARSVTGLRSVALVLRRLADAGFLEESGGGYSLRGFLGLIAQREPGACSMVERLGEHYLSSREPGGLLKALRIYFSLGNWRGVMRAARRRMLVIRHRVFPVLGEYRALLEAAAEAMGDPVGRPRGYVLAELGVARLNTGSPEAALEALREALGVATRHGDIFLEAFAHSLLLWFYPYSIEEDEARWHMEEGLRLAQHLKGAWRLTVLDRLYANIARYYAMKNDYERVLEYVEHEAAVARMIGDPLDEALAHVHHAVALADLGRLDEAQGYIEEGIGMLLELEDEGYHFLPAAWRILGGILAARDRLREALPVLRSAAEEAARINDYNTAVEAYADLLAVETLLGLREAAEETMARLEELLGPPGSWGNVAAAAVFAAAAAARLTRRSDREMLEEKAAQMASVASKVAKGEFSLQARALRAVGLEELADTIAA